jgi:transposase-like protein
MDFTGKLSSHPDQTLESPEADTLSDISTRDLAVKDQEFIAQEQDRVISRLVSIVDYGKMAGGSNATAITVTDGHGQESIEIEEPVNVNIEMNGVDSADNVKLEDGEEVIQKEDTADVKTEETEDSDIRIWQSDLTKSEPAKIMNFNEDARIRVKPSAVDTPTDCGGSSSSKTDNYMNHGEQRFSCTVCGKSFTRKNGLTRHNLSHSEEKPYPCTVCGKSFKTKGSLAQHNLLHSGEKRHSCTVCGKSFTQ